MKYSPVIVVVAFNRPKSLQRLLFSLSNLKGIQSARLIISIDNKEPDNYPVRDLANDFHWPYGEKEVIYQEKRLGLKQHILKCGDLAYQYGSVIILEDDLFVSPHFYNYALHALDYYDNDPKIGGISLYDHTYEDITDLPFRPIIDDSDVYFIQFPSSLGQAWSKSQWSDFRKWFDSNQDISNVPIHRQIINWPETSWKKYFVAYLKSTDKYMVFPRTSFTTNFNDIGTHKWKSENFNGQTQLRLSDPTYRFKDLKDSLSVYDAFFELSADVVKQFLPALRKYDFELDLYGLKDPDKVQMPLLITSKPAKNPLMGFQRALKPHDANILFGLQGNDLLLCNKEDVLPVEKPFMKELSDFKYFYTSFLLGKRAYIYNDLSKYKMFAYLLNKLF